MKGVTIDQLDLKDHVRWAEDQQVFDVTLVQESQLVGSHPSILGTSAIYSSKFEELFELYKRSNSWAFFPPPKNFTHFSKRLFSHRLFSDMDWEEEENEEQEQETVSHDLMQKIATYQIEEASASSVFEKDKSAVLSLLESMNWLTDMLKQIYGRKMQHQKG